MARIRFPFTKKDLAIFTKFTSTIYKEDGAIPSIKYLPDWSEKEMRVRFDLLVDFLCKRIVKMWMEDPQDFEYIAVWRTSHLMHYGTDEDERPWGQLETFSDCNDLYKKDVFRFFGIKDAVINDYDEEGGFTEAFETTEAFKLRHDKENKIKVRIKKELGNPNPKTQGLFLCIEPTADGDTFFIVEDEHAFELVGRLTDAIYGSPGEVDYWGGRKIVDFNYLCVEHDLSEDVTTIADVINALMIDGLKVATKKKVAAQLAKAKPRLPGNILVDGLPSALFE